jgi:phosphatidylglycerol---prolipoprotein diacylglyceryl transferase
MQALAIPYPEIDPVAIWLGPLPVKWYGLAYVAGLVLGRFYVRALLRRNRLWPGEKPPFTVEQADDLLLFMTVGVLLGGRLGYVLFYQPLTYVNDPLEVLAVWHGGMSFHGALIGSILAIYHFARRVGADVWSVLDVCAAATPMGLFFGRLANFINAELWGRTSDVPWAMVFPGPGAGALPRHPSQLYEAALEGAVLFAVLWWLTHRRLALRKPGIVGGAFLAGYGLARSFCELFREPDPGHVFTLGLFTAGILYSLPMILIGLWMMLRASRRVAATPDAQR